MNHFQNEMYCPRRYLYWRCYLSRHMNYENSQDPTGTLDARTLDRSGHLILVLFPGCHYLNRIRFVLLDFRTLQVRAYDAAVVEVLVYRRSTPLRVEGDWGCVRPGRFHPGYPIGHYLGRLTFIANHTLRRCSKIEDSLKQVLRVQFFL